MYCTKCGEFLNTAGHCACNTNTGIKIPDIQPQIIFKTTEVLLLERIADTLEKILEAVESKK